MVPAEIRHDDEVTDWQYQWQGPDGAESWWPAMPFVHAQIYLLTQFAAFALGLLLAWGFGAGLISRVLPVVVSMGVTWLVVSEWVKHVDAVRPIAWHRAVLRSELRAPRPERVRSTRAGGPGPAPEQVVSTTAAHLVAEEPVERPGGEPCSGVLA
jgi:hypothetical protein